jgi:hypothetical protein
LEELNQDLFYRFYEENSIPFDTPETKAVKKYITDHDTINVPVDINVSDTLSTQEINLMFDSLKKYHAYATLEQEEIKKISEEGFVFLNSLEGEEIFEKKKSLAKSLIEFEVNKNQFSRTHHVFYEEEDIREYSIINNVYNFSEIMPYNQALLLIGSGHRKTIFEKVKTFNMTSHIKLNWALWGSDPS